MKRMLLASATLAALSLAACGGGGSSGGGTTVPSPVSTSTPAPFVKTVLFGWRGSMAPGGAVQPQSDLRHPMAAASSTPIPVLMSPCDPSAELCSYFGQAAPGLGGAAVTPVESGVSPQQQPTLTVSSPSIAVSIPSPAPSATPVYPFQLIPPATPGAYTATATFPDHTTGTIPVYVYHRVTVGCGPNQTTPTLSLSPGYNFDSGSASSTMASSDIYVTGPACPAPFTDPSGYTLHVPAGWSGSALSSALTMANIQPTSWSSQFTSMDLATFGQGKGGQLLLAKTAQGHIVKFEWLEEFGGNAGDQGLTGSYWVSADGVTFSQ